jgi:hypothetical protein
MGWVLFNIISGSSDEEGFTSVPKVLFLARVVQTQHVVGFTDDI